MAATTFDSTVQNGMDDPWQSIDDLVTHLRAFAGHADERDDGAERTGRVRRIWTRRSSARR